MRSVAKAVDAAGQDCPMPVPKTAQAAKESAVGEVVLIMATDNAARSDIPAWARQTGIEVTDTSKGGNVLKFSIRKK